MRACLESLCCALRSRLIAIKPIRSRPFRGPFSLEAEWPRNGSTEGAKDAGPNTCLREKLRAIAAPSADFRLHTVGSVFRAVPGAQEGGA
jgi:hypothetical protein